jgi:hypothetical protein
MIISHKHRFIFIKTAKTAGTSIEIFLSPHCGEDDVFTPIHPHVDPHRPRNFTGLWNPLPEWFANRFERFRHTLRDLLQRRKFINHLPARLAKYRMPREIWDGYFKFCVERNPWDKTLSHFHMLRKMMAENEKIDLDFDTYLARGRFCTNIEKYTDIHGNLMVDRVLRFENLNEELAEVFSRFGIPFDGTLGVNAKANFRKDRRPYQEIYSENQRRIVENAFADEIQMHGYEF